MLPSIERVPRAINHLYRLTIQVKGLVSDVYSMSTSVDAAFSRYRERLARQHGDVTSLQLIRGELADPHSRD